MMKYRAFFSFLAIFALLAAVAPAQKNARSDDELYDTVRRKLASDPVVKGGAFEVDVKDGVVTIKGTVENEKQKSKAERVTKKISGVKQVVNQLNVVARTPR